jgi:hypothetical protein
MADVGAIKALTSPVLFYGLQIRTVLRNMSELMSDNAQTCSPVAKRNTDHASIVFPCQGHA